MNWLQQVLLHGWNPKVLMLKSQMISDYVIKDKKQKIPNSLAKIIHEREQTLRLMGSAAPRTIKISSISPNKNKK